MEEIAFYNLKLEIYKAVMPYCQGDFVTAMLWAEKLYQWVTSSNQKVKGT